MLTTMKKGRVENFSSTIGSVRSTVTKSDRQFRVTYSSKAAGFGKFISSPLVLRTSGWWRTSTGNDGVIGEFIIRNEVGRYAGAGTDGDSTCKKLLSFKLKVDEASEDKGSCVYDESVPS